MCKYSMALNKSNYSSNYTNKGFPRIINRDNSKNKPQQTSCRMAEKSMSFSFFQVLCINNMMKTVSFMALRLLASVARRSIRERWSPVCHSWGTTVGLTQVQPTDTISVLKRNSYLTLDLLACFLFAFLCFGTLVEDGR